MGTTISKPSQECSPCGYEFVYIGKVREDGQPTVLAPGESENNFIYDFNTTYECSNN